MSFRQKLGLDPVTTTKLADFLSGKPESKLDEIDLFLMMRGDIQTKEGVNLIQFLSLVGHPDGFNSDVARFVLNVVLASGIGLNGKRSELIAAVMSQGNIQNEQQRNLYDFSGVRKDKDDD